MCTLTKTNEFITKARLVHGDAYGYDKSVYVNAKTKLIITCFEHGDFEQTPNNHLKNRKCPACAKVSRAKSQMHTRDTFITKSKNTHGDRYDYDQVIYKNSTTKVTIICPLHGPFSQLPPKHIGGMPRMRQCCQRGSFVY